MEPVITEKVYIDGYLDIETFSNLSGISIDDIQKFNPSILKGVLPIYTRGFELKIPTEYYSYFEANRQMILDSAQKQGIQLGQTTVEGYLKKIPEALERRGKSNS